MKQSRLTSLVEALTAKAPVVVATAFNGNPPITRKMLCTACGNHLAWREILALPTRNRDARQWKCLM